MYSLFGHFAILRHREMAVIIQRNKDLHAYMHILMGVQSTIPEIMSGNAQIPFPMLAQALEIDITDVIVGNIPMNELPDIVTVRLSDLQRRLGLIPEIKREK